MISASPLQTVEAFRLGPVAISEAVATTWLVMAVLVLASWALTRRMSATEPGPAQVVAEMLVTGIEAEIRSIARRDPGPFGGLVATLFLFILAGNLVGLVPGLHPPTARLETTGALAVIVFAAIQAYGLGARGPLGYFAKFTKPALVMLPLNLVSEVSRILSLMVRLFGNMMSGEMVMAVVIALAGLFVPVPFMALDLLVGLIQAYIFTVLATVFIAAAMGDEAPEPEQEQKESRSMEP